MNKKLSFPRQSPLKQIRKHCVDVCMNGHMKDVLFCRDTKCLLWYLRLGMHPNRAINQNGKRYEEVFKPENFKKGARYCPDILTPDLEL